uniref:Uncharacterized protein n=1 Tax=Anguilla anguilla TaxID=7936 RepID=A0A0E9WEU5_ANGAN
MHVWSRSLQHMSVTYVFYAFRFLLKCRIQYSFLFTNYQYEIESNNIKILWNNKKRKKIYRANKTIKISTKLQIFLQISRQDSLFLKQRSNKNR